MKRMVLALFLLPSVSMASDWSDTLQKACLNEKSSLEICRQANSTIKDVEHVANKFIKDQNLQHPVALIAFSVNTLKTKEVSIPQVLPTTLFKNNLSISPDKVYFSITFNM
jgi:hypothetical protein